MGKQEFVNKPRVTKENIQQEIKEETSRRVMIIIGILLKYIECQLCFEIDTLEW